jgi:Ca-activated chloride channel family protein
VSGRGRLRALLLIALAALLAVPSAPSAQEGVRRRGFAVQITEPANDDIVVGRTRIAANVATEDPSVVDRVEFFVDDKLVFVDREAPYETVHDFGETPLSFIVRAVAWHKEGISVATSIVTRRVLLGTTTEVNRVVLWATAVDKEDNLVADLKQEDFRILEGRQPQQLLEFAAEDRPITLAILLDTSGSMRDQIKEVHQAAGSFVDTLRPEDRALVIDFNETVFLIQELTADHAALKEAITSTEPIGPTAIYDAMHATYRKLKGVEGRKAMVLLSDGEDTASDADLQRVLDQAKRNNVLIYAIGMGAGFGDGPRKSVLRQFSETTGGRAFFVGKATELGAAYQQIAEELRRQYVLTYETAITEWNGRWVELEVQSTKPGVKIRARRGFFAVKGQTPN